MTNPKQPSFFDQTHEDLPLINGTGQRAAPHPSVKSRPPRASHAPSCRCLKCKDTGFIREREFCYCDAGRQAFQDRPQITSPASAAGIFQNLIGASDKECLIVMALDTRNNVLGVETVYKGTINSIIIRQAEVFNSAVKLNACAIIICHNHPSGNPDPSPEDILVTNKTIEAGNILDIEVMDHIIVGPFSYVSLKERDLCDF